MDSAVEEEATEGKRRKTGQTAGETQSGATEAGAAQAALMDSPERFVNRELSWLEFNRRVLEEAQNPRNPLLERVRFLSISANNLDVFLMVRVAGIISQVNQGVEARSADGLTPREQLVAVEQSVSELQRDQQNAWVQLDMELEKEGIIVAHPRELGKVERQWLEEHFMESVFPVLTPLSIDPAHPFPFIPNLGSALVFELKAKSDGDTMLAMLRLPLGLRRFAQMPQRSSGRWFSSTSRTLSRCSSASCFQVMKPSVRAISG